MIQHSAKGMTPVEKRMTEGLRDLYGMAARVAFGWAELHRRAETTPWPVRSENSETRMPDPMAEPQMLDGGKQLGVYMTHVPGFRVWPDRPGSPVYPIRQDFADMTKSAEEWDAVGERMVRAHDSLAVMLDKEARQERGEAA